VQHARQIQHEALAYCKTYCVQTCNSTNDSINCPQGDAKEIEIYNLTRDEEVRIPETMPKIIGFIFCCIHVLKECFGFQ
jgi:hypothetical protein